MGNFDTIIQSAQPVLVDFFAEWCGPCKTMKPILKEVEGNLEGKALVHPIDVDEQEVLAARFHIQAVPTFILFKDGQPVWRHTGVIPSKDLLNVINQYT